jgi:hypothetical protein
MATLRAQVVCCALTTDWTFQMQSHSLNSVYYIHQRQLTNVQLHHQTRRRCELRQLTSKQRFNRFQIGQQQQVQMI